MLYTVGGKSLPSVFPPVKWGYSNISFAYLGWKGLALATCVYSIWWLGAPGFL